MSEEREVGKGLFVWSGQLIKVRPEWVPMADVRENVVACDRCGRTVDYAWIGVIDEQGFQEVLDYLRDYLAEQKCGEHHLPPVR